MGARLGPRDPTFSAALWSSSFDKLRMRTIVQVSAAENLILSLSKDEIFAPEVDPYPAPGIGSFSMISTESPGKIAKCGWFSNIAAAAAWDSARTMM